MDRHGAALFLIRLTLSPHRRLHIMPSVAYWTSALHPEMEAIASEVTLLRRHFRSSVAWGVSPSVWLRLSWRRGFGVHPRLHLAFRAATWVLQRAFRINHVFGGLGDWFHLKAARNRPLILTVATSTPPCDRELLERVDRIVVEWPSAREELRRLNLGGARTELVLPPVDLERFRPSPAAEGPLRVLFASSPDRPDWLEARGVPLLLDAAERLPHVQFRLLWRPWGTSYEHVKSDVARRGLRNVEIHRERIGEMGREYRESHLTIAPFTDMSRCKAVPNSLIESLACGRPVVTTFGVGLADIIRDERCGVVAETSADGIAEAIERVAGDYPTFSSTARRTAEKWFAASAFVKSYERIYQQVL